MADETKWSEFVDGIAFSMAMTAAIILGAFLSEEGITWSSILPYLALVWFCPVLFTALSKISDRGAARARMRAGVNADGG